MTSRIPRCHPISGTLAVIAALLLNACGRPTVVIPAAPTPEPSPAAASAGEPEASASVPATATASPQGREGEPLISDAAVRDWLRRANEAYVPVPPDPAGRQLVVGGSSDSAGGLSFDTIQKALDAARPGDRILVRAGHYSETVRFPRSGAEGKPIILEGERGTNGEWLSVIDPGVPLKGWTPAPEIGEGVFKRPSDGADPYCLTSGGRQVLRIHDRLMALPWTPPEPGAPRAPLHFGGIKDFEDAGVSGLSFLTVPSDGVVGMMREAEGALPFWNGIEAAYGVRDGLIYLRFRDGRNPDEASIRAAPAVTAITIENQSHIIVRNLAVRGAEKGIVLSGGKAKNNIIENNRFLNGLWRVVITSGAAENLIRANELSLGFFGSDDFGAWGGTHQEKDANRKSQVRMILYRAFKHLSGTDASADIAMRITAAGPGNRISGNHIFGGLKGLHCMSTPDLTVDGNVIHNMSSVGVVTLPDLWNARFHGNLYFDCNIILRIHQYNSPSHRSEYHYGNIFRQSSEEGTHVYVHYNDFGADFGPEQESPIGIYQNTFVGGMRGLVCGSMRRDIGMTRTMVLNNIISTAHEPVSYLHSSGDARIYQIFDYNWVGGGRQAPGALPKWFASHNIDAPGRELWPADYRGDFSPPAEVRGKGIDLSREFVIDDKHFEPLPGMNPGYFSGSAPDLGAIQSR